MQSRVEQAVEAFESGYNCAQSLFSTYADLFGMDRETALKLSSAMGAGVGRMREVCGAVSGMALLAGLKEGTVDPEDSEGKARIYTLVQRMSAVFMEEQGSIVCRELLGLEKGEDSEPRPAERTAQYYETRPCAGAIACAARIVEDMLL